MALRAARDMTGRRHDGEDVCLTVRITKLGAAGPVPGRDGFGRIQEHEARPRVCAAADWDADGGPLRI